MSDCDCEDEERFTELQRVRDMLDEWKHEQIREDRECSTSPAMVATEDGDD